MKISLSESYTVLGLSKNCTEAELKAAYKKNALASHPDKNTHDSTEEFQRVSTAYENINKVFNPPPPQTSNPFQQYQRQQQYHHHHHHHEYSDEEDYDEEYYDDDEDDEDEYDFAQQLFESMFAGMMGGGGRGGGGGGGSPFGGMFGGSLPAGMQYGGDSTFIYTPGVSQMQGNQQEREYFREEFEESERPVETPEAFSARMKLEKEAVLRAAERRKEEEERERVKREREKINEMKAGAARRETKLLSKKEKAAAEKAASAARAAELLVKAQANRSAVFAAARRGDSAAVKKGIWEDNVECGDVERLFGFLSPEEKARELESKRKEAEQVLAEEQEEEVVVEKENIATGTSSKNKKKKKGKGGAAANGSTTSQETKPNTSPTPLPPTSDPLKPTTNKSTPLPPKTNGSNSDNKVKGKETRPPRSKRGQDEKETLLHIAVKKGDADLAEWLVDQGADLEQRDSTEFTPIHYALQLGPLALVQSFLSSNPFPSSDTSTDAYYPCPPGESLLSLAISSTDPKIVELVIDSKTVSVEEGWKNWNFIEGYMKSAAGKKLTQKEKDVWEDIKWAITNLEGFVAPSGYANRTRRRARTSS